MAICPIHGVDHELEDNEKVADYSDPNSDAVKALEKAQSLLFNVLTDLPMSVHSEVISENVVVHFLPNQNVTQEMRNEIVETVKELEKVSPATRTVEVYFPVPVRAMVDLNYETFAKGGFSNIPRSEVEKALKGSISGQTFQLIQYAPEGGVDIDKTFTSAPQILFLYEGTINAERRNPYDRPESIEEQLTKVLAGMMGKDEPSPKRPEKMFLAYSIFTPLIYALVHEYGHVKDRRSVSDRMHFMQFLMDLRDHDPIRFKAFFDQASEMAYRGQDKESYAEAWVEWVATNGRTNNVLAVTYAKANEWPTWDNWKFPNDPIDFDAELIDPDVIEASNPWGQ